MLERADFGPEGGRPKDYDFGDAEWLKPFKRLYWVAWVIVIGVLLAT